MTLNAAPTQSWPDLAGRLMQAGGQKRHIMPVRVYFEDTDAGGVAYHASYVRWCERGRSDFLRLLGTDARRMINGSDNQEPAAFVVRKMTFDFARPALMDDILEIATSVRELGGASVALTQQVLRDGKRICEADVTVVLVSVSGKPLRLPEGVRASLSRSPQS